MTAGVLTTGLVVAGALLGWRWLLDSISRAAAAPAGTDDQQQNQ